MPVDVADLRARLELDLAPFTAKFAEMRQQLAVMKQRAEETAKGTDKLKVANDAAGKSLVRFTEHTKTTTLEMSKVANAVRLAAAPIARELSPALGEAASQAAGAVTIARSLGGRLGVIGALATLAAIGVSKYAAALKSAAEFQADLNFAAKAGRGEDIRSQLESALKEKSRFEFETRDPFSGTAVAAYAAEAARRLSGGEAFDVMISKAQTALRQVVPAEIAQVQTQDALQRLRAANAQLSADAQRTKDVKALNDQHEELILNLDKEFSLERKLVELEAHRALQAPGLLPEEAQSIIEHFQSQELALFDVRAARRGAAQTQRETAINALIKQQVEQTHIPDFPDLEGLATPAADIAAAARGVRTTRDVLDELKPKLIENANAARVFGRSFDGIAEEMSLIQQSMQDFIKLGLDPADQRLQGLKARFDELRTFTEVREDVHAALSDITGSITASVQAMVQGTQTLGDAFVNLGNTIVNGFLNAVFRAAFRPAEVGIENFIANLGIAAASGITGGNSHAIDLGINAPRTASGGIVNSPQLRLVGEAGPEAIVPLSQWGQPQVTIINNVPGADVSAKTGPDGRSLRIAINAMVRSGINNGEFDQDLGANYGITRAGTRR